MAKIANKNRGGSECEYRSDFPQFSGPRSGPSSHTHLSTKQRKRGAQKNRRAKSPRGIFFCHFFAAFWPDLNRRISRAVVWGGASQIAMQKRPPPRFFVFVRCFLFAFIWGIWNFFSFRRNFFARGAANDKVQFGEPFKERRFLDLWMIFFLVLWSPKNSSKHSLKSFEVIQGQIHPNNLLKSPKKQQKIAAPFFFCALITKQSIGVDTKHTKHTKHTRGWGVVEAKSRPDIETAKKCAHKKN